MGDAESDVESGAHICAQVKQAFAEKLRLDVCGRSSKPWRQSQAQGQTDVARQVLSVAEHRGVVSHDPSELVVTVRAGTPLAELDNILAEQGQMLAAECQDFPGGSTIGGALALGWSGSRQPYTGSLRDCVLGVRMVNGLGQPLRFGGQVMKNVAGYDIPRLLSGSLGRLGVILDISLKLLPLPERELSLLFEIESLARSRRFVQKVVRAGEPITGACYQAGQLRLRFSGRSDTLQRLANELGGREIDPVFWRELRQLRLDLFADPEIAGPAASAALYDWNGALCWSRSPQHTVQRKVGENNAVDLHTGPSNPAIHIGPLAELQRRVALAFDPGQVFQVSRAEAA